VPVAGPPSGDSGDSSESEVKVVSAFGGGGGLLASGSPSIARTMPQGSLSLGFDRVYVRMSMSVFVCMSMSALAVRSCAVCLSWTVV
jgi:hypothetical protein